MTVKQLKNGELFTKRAIEYPNAAQVWIRGDYDRASKRYECQIYDDINRFCYMRGDKEIFVDFVF